MYSVDALESTIRELYYEFADEFDDIESERTEELLHRIDYDRLLQAVYHNATTVHAYTTDGQSYSSLNYRGTDVFERKATLLHSWFNRWYHADAVCASRNYELWLLEDMTLAVVACVSISYEGGEYRTKYREVKKDDIGHSGLSLNLDEFTAALMKMYEPWVKCNPPVYEL